MEGYVLKKKHCIMFVCEREDEFSDNHCNKQPLGPKMCQKGVIW